MEKEKWTSIMQERKQELIQAEKEIYKRKEYIKAKNKIKNRKEFIYFIFLCVISILFFFFVLLLITK